jgi:acetylornithine deacetylase/succinyl-diaminopimelate desuccinylase-like protein
MSATLFLLLAAQANNWFAPALLQKPEIQKALASIDERKAPIVEEWIKVTEIPAPSTKEQARARYVRGEMEKLGLTDIRSDDMMNLSGTRKGIGGGPTVVFAAHMDTVFPESTDVKVKREGDILRAPGIGDDTGNLVATLEMFRALNRAQIKTKGDLIFLASVQEEIGLLGAKHWLENVPVKPDMFIAVDGSAREVWYGALRINQFKFFYTSPGAHTLESRDTPTPSRAVANAIKALYEIPLPAYSKGLGNFKLPVINVGMLGGGTVFNAVPREAWFTVDLRSLDNALQDRLDTAVVAAAKRAADQEGVGFRVERKMAVDYSKAKPQPERLNHAVVQTALAAINHYRQPGSPAIQAADAGSTDANIAVSMGIPAVSIGAAITHMAHRLEETAEASTIIPGIKSMVVLAVALASH